MFHFIFSVICITVFNYQSSNFVASVETGRIADVIADALSSNPFSCFIDVHSFILFVENTEYTNCFLPQNAPIDLQLVADGTSKDVNLHAVIHPISNSWKVSNAHDLKPFYSFREEISMKVYRCS